MRHEHCRTLRDFTICLHNRTTSLLYRSFCLCVNQSGSNWGLTGHGHAAFTPDATTGLKLFINDLTELPHSLRKNPQGFSKYTTTLVGICYHVEADAKNRLGQMLLYNATMLRQRLSTCSSRSYHVEADATRFRQMLHVYAGAVMYRQLLPCSRRRYHVYKMLLTCYAAAHERPSSNSWQDCLLSCVSLRTMRSLIQRNIHELCRHLSICCDDDQPLQCDAELC